MERKELLQQLKKEIPYQWRVQSFSKTKAEATCVAYIDARDAMNILDEYCTEGWQKDYKEIKGNLFCGIGISINGTWEWRWDCGTESNTEKEKGEASDSFKRAAVNWGIGRFLYDLEIKRISANEAKTDKNYPYPIDEQGKRIWDLSKHFAKPQPKTQSIPAQPIRSDAKPKINDAQLKRVIERIGNGETDAYDASLKAFDLNDEQKKQLKETYDFQLLTK